MSDVHISNDQAERVVARLNGWPSCVHHQDAHSWFESPDGDVSHDPRENYKTGLQLFEYILKSNSTGYCESRDDGWVWDGSGGEATIPFSGEGFLVAVCGLMVLIMEKEIRDNSI